MNIEDKNYVWFTEIMMNVSNAIFDLRESIIDLYLIQGDERAIYELETMLSTMKSDVINLELNLKDQQRGQ